VGFQQWLSIIAGIAMLVFVFFGAGILQKHPGNAALWVKSLFRRFLQKRSFFGAFLLGAANGLLPCGLVYMAGTASAATGQLWHAALFMFVFGLGTLPVMFGLSVSKTLFPNLLSRFAFRGVVPITTAAVAILLIVRGAGLGIPYLSPESSNSAITCPACIR
jgi:sulfite exporter TauE/SafE